MNRKLNVLLILLTTFFGQLHLRAQTEDPQVSIPPCLANSEFDHVPGPLLYTSSGNCQYWNTGGVLNWIRSHGTPSIETFPNPIDNYVFLWGATPRGVFTGEGMFAGFTFTANVSYTAKIRVQVTDAGNAGHFDLYCANGLGEPPIFGCGSSIPVLPSNQLFQITANYERNVGWKTYEYVFTPNNNFSQVWIYPYTPGTNQISLYIDYIRICRTDCVNTGIYNTGVLPTGDTRRGTIFIGSTAGTGGSGTVTVSPTGQTTMIAAKEINIVPEFNATVTTGSFNARIEPCTNGQSFRARVPEQHDIDATMERSGGGMNESLPDSLSSNDQAKDVGSLQVFPNPSDGRFKIDATGIGNGPIEIEVYDPSGVFLFRKKIGIGDSKFISVDLFSYKAGCYMVKLIGGDGSKTVKAFVIH